MRNVLYAECAACGQKLEAVPDLTLCDSCGGALDIRYNYAYIAKRLGSLNLMSSRDYSMWRYRIFLPVREDSPAPPLRAGWSPLYSCPRLASEIGVRYLFIKNDGQNPTSSLKDRASSIAIVKAREAGATAIACASTGNAASSLAGAAASSGLRSYIFVPERAPRGKIAQLLIFGARVFTVGGDYSDAFRSSKAAIEKYGWYNRNAAVNPYLAEGKKTVSFEIAEQLAWKTPDYVCVSVGDGCTIAGVWKGFKDLYETGLIERLPRLVSVQAAGCCPINRAAKTGKPIERSTEDTVADSIAVGTPRNPVKALAAIAESKGVCVEVDDREILEAMRLVGQLCGVFAEPAGAAGTAGLIKAVKSGLIPPDARVVSIVTGNGLKDSESGIKAAGNPLALRPGEIPDCRDDG